MRTIKLLYFFCVSILTAPRRLLNELFRLSEQLYHKHRCGAIPLKTVCISNFFTQETIRNYTYLDGTSTVLDIALLKSIARSISDCMYLEIGTWRGESLVNVADVAMACGCVSLEYSKDFVCDRAENPTSESEEKSSVILPDLIDKNFKFDLIFIDGSHEFADIAQDTENAFKLLRPNGVIVWHDYGLTTEKVNWTTLDAIIEGCPIDRLSNLYHVSNTLCAIYTERELKPVEQMGLFEIAIRKTR